MRLSTDFQFEFILLGRTFPSSTPNLFSPPLKAAPKKGFPFKPGRRLRYLNSLDIKKSFSFYQKVFSFIYLLPVILCQTEPVEVSSIKQRLKLHYVRVSNTKKTFQRFSWKVLYSSIETGFITFIKNRSSLALAKTYEFEIAIISSKVIPPSNSIIPSDILINLNHFMSLMLKNLANQNTFIFRRFLNHLFRIRTKRMNFQIILLRIFNRRFY